jgi:hypothetical protein
MIANRAWVLLPSGRRLDLLNPDPQAWTDHDLAVGLSRTYRWGGVFGLGPAIVRCAAQSDSAGDPPGITRA